MPIDPSPVGTTSEPVRRSWTSTDAILYALGVGAGAVDPLDPMGGHVHGQGSALLFDGWRGHPVPGSSLVRVANVHMSFFGRLRLAAMRA